MRDLRPGQRQPDRATLLEQARQGFAVLWCAACDHFWREQNDQGMGWGWTVPMTRYDAGGRPPGNKGCPRCGGIYLVWENYPEAAGL